MESVIIKYAVASCQQWLVFQIKSLWRSQSKVGVTIRHRRSRGKTGWAEPRDGGGGESGKNEGGRDEVAEARPTTLLAPLPSQLSSGL